LVFIRREGSSKGTVGSLETTNDITIFGSVFPRSKGYDDERVIRDEVVFFIFAGKFAANMAVKCM
jgi:hypothetical protein